MNFEIGAQYYTRRHGVATIKRWYKGRKHFKALLELKPTFINVNLRQGTPFLFVKYDELGNAVEPKNKAYDLMKRLREKSHY